MTPARTIGPIGAHATPDQSSHLGSGLAREVHDARRERGMSVTALASASRVTVGDVRSAEEGEPVSAHVASELCVILGLGKCRHVPGMAPSRPHPMDGDHERRMRRIDDLLGSRPGFITYPDLVAERAAKPPEGAPMWERLVPDRVRRLGVDGATKLGIGVVIADVLLAPWAVGLVTSSHFVRDVIEGVILAGGMALTTLPSVLGLGWLLIDHHRLRGLGRLRAQPHDGYLLTATGASSLRVIESGLVMRDSLAHVVSSVAYVSHGAGHVSLHVDGDLGRFSMPWLPRTRDLSDAVAAWNAPVSEVSGSEVR